MRLSNYLTVVDLSLRETIEAIRAIKPLHDATERNWRSAETKAKEATCQARKLKEEFRDVHLTLAKLKQRQGELEEDRFKFDDEREAWK